MVMFLHTRTWPNLVTCVKGSRGGSWGYKLALGPRRRCHSPERTRGKRGSHGKQRKLLNLRNCSSFFLYSVALPAWQTIKWSPRLTQAAMLQKLLPHRIRFPR